MKPPVPQAPKPEPTAAATSKKAPGFTERVLDNIKFQIGQVTLRLHTLGIFILIDSGHVLNASRSTFASLQASHRDGGRRGRQWP